MALTEQAIASPQVTLLTTDKVVGLEKGIRSWSVTPCERTTINTQLVVGADGAFSVVRQLAGIDIDTWDYQQQAIVCSVKNRTSTSRLCAKIFF